LLAYSDLRQLAAHTVRAVAEQAGGTHADEIETSVMLYIAPDRVQPDKAVCDYHPGAGRLTRDPNMTGATYSPSGVFGDATLASRDKGRAVTEAIVAGLLADIERVRQLSLTV
jgi:creatinine amidohydrolase